MSNELRPTWPHLENLHKVLADDPEFFDPNPDRVAGLHRQWTITEKVHGFNARFGIDRDGVAWVGGRNEVVAEGDPGGWPTGKLQGFVAFAASKVQGLARGDTLFGEWAGKGIQKGIDYGAKDFYAFGLMADGMLRPWGELSATAYDIGVKTVPLVAKVYQPPQPEALLGYRELQSNLAESTWEGVVVSAYPPKVSPYGHVVIVKVKSPQFAETAREKKTRPDGREVLLTHARAFAEEYVNETRLEHVLGQALELGPYDPFDNRMIGTVLRLMFEDVVREGATDYEKLTDDDKKVVGKVVNELTKPLLTAARDATILETKETTDVV